MTDVDRELEAVDDQSAAAVVISATLTQKDVYPGTNSTRGIDRGTSAAPNCATPLGSQIRQLDPWVLTLDLFSAPQSRFLFASCLNHLMVPQTLRITTSSSIQQQCCKNGIPHDIIIVSSILRLCENALQITHLSSPKDKTIMNSTSMSASRITQSASTF